MNPSSQPRSTSLSDNYKENITTEVTQYLVVAAVIIIVVVLVLVTGLCFVRICNCSSHHRKLVHNREYEMKNVTEEQNDPDCPRGNNDEHAVPMFSNPAYYRYNKQAPDGLYSEVQMYAQVTDGTHTKFATGHGENFIGTYYDVITPAVSTKKSDQETIESAA